MSDFALALDLSSPKGSFCLFRQGPSTLLVSQELPGTFSHSETLLSELQQSLSTHGLLLEQLQFMVVSSGPGSFTGLRIAFATVKAFSIATQKPIITVEGPEARAHAFLVSQDKTFLDHPIQVLTYLTADKVARSNFQWTNQGLEKTEENVVSLGSFSPNPKAIVLLDERMDSLPDQNLSKNVLRFPLTAKHLSSCKDLKSQRVFNPQELVSLSPHYFGSSHFD